MEKSLLTGAFWENVDGARGMQQKSKNPVRTVLQHVLDSTPIVAQVSKGTFRIVKVSISGGRCKK